MTRNTFLFLVAGVTVYYLALLVVAWCGYSFDSNNWSVEAKFIKDFVAILTALPAAFLAFAVQQRLVFIKEMRDIYKDCLVSVEEAIYFCKSRSFESDEKLHVLKSLSIAIDKVRAVLSNGKSKSYPVVGMHKIYKIIDKMSHEGEMLSAHDEIIDLWKSTRQIFLDEMDRGDHRLTYKDQYAMLNTNR